MSDPRFFSPRGPFTAALLAKLSGSELAGASDPERQLSDIASLDQSGPGEISFLDNRKYEDALPASKAGAIILAPAMVSKAPLSAVLIVNAKPYKAFAQIAQLFHPIQSEQAAGISDRAVIDPMAKIGVDCEIGPGAVIEADVEVGDKVRIGPNTVVSRGVVIGNDTSIAANVTLSHCYIGQRVRILPGVRIGQEGFGFAIDAAGHVRIPQLGRVIVEDDVEIGANTTIDRGAAPDTVIGRGTMIDNLVQIGHNVSIGPGCIIVAQAGVSGSVRVEQGVAIGGQVGIAGHLTIGAGSQIAAQSGIMRDVPRGARMMGYPAVRSRRFFRQLAWIEKSANGDNEDDRDV
jgi:UDP-3-O-[3-hydroxymyristoyl] glucosamine N-acyltransferase